MYSHGDFFLQLGLINVLTTTLLAIGIFFFTPLRGLFDGSDLENYREVAEMNARRAAAFEDSVAMQYRQITQLRALITGDLDSLTTTVPVSEDPFPSRALLRLRLCLASRWMSQRLGKPGKTMSSPPFLFDGLM